VGEKIRINDSPLIPDQEILEIKHKYLYALHSSLAEFNSLFPSERGLLGLRINTDKPDTIIDQMRPILAERSFVVRETFANYRQSQLPIGVIARATHDEPIDVWYGMMQHDVEIDVCLGTAPERTEALQLLSSYPALMLDPITFWIAGVLDVLDALQKTFGPLALTRSAVDVLQRRRDEHEEATRRQPHSLWERDGQIGYTVYSEDQARAAFNHAEKILHWASEHTIIVPAVPAKDLPPQVWQIGECMDPSFIDTIAAASGSGRVLLSEDRRFRGLAAAAAQIRGIWLQLALGISVTRGNLDKRRYSDLVVDLALAGHSVTSLDAEALFHAAKRNNWCPSGAYTRITALLSSQRVEVNSLITVATAFVQLLWSHNLPRKSKEELTATLLNAILAAHPSKAQQIILLLSDHGKPTQGHSMSSRLRARSAFREFMQQWWKENLSGGPASGDNGEELACSEF
jgi:cellulose synthase operon protein C